MRAAPKAAATSAITKLIVAIVIPFDDTEHLPADMELQFHDGSRLSVEAITKLPNSLYPDMTTFRGRFGSPGEEFVIDINVADAVLDRISRRKARA